MSIAVKICGLKDKDSLHAAVEGGAAYLGFNFIPASKRYLPPSAAQELLGSLPQPALCRFTHATAYLEDSGQMVLVGLFSNPTDIDLQEAQTALSPFLGLIQLHGQETPERVEEIRALTGLPVMKAIPLKTPEDLALARAFDKVADMLLFDSKAEHGPSGGTGHSFDWTLLKGKRFKKPWMIAGGIDINNAKAAVKATRAKIIDVASGVETNGRKDPEKILSLLKACHEK